MKHFPLLLLLLLTLSSCLVDDCESETTYRVYDPITVPVEAYKSNTFTPETARHLCEPSGFYVYGDLLLTVDNKAGLHITDNSDIARPEPLSFIPIPGAEGLAVRNSILYIRQFNDLLAFSLTNPQKPEFVSRQDSVFEGYYPIFRDEVGTQQIVLDYATTDRTVTYSCTDLTDEHHPMGGLGYYYRGQLLVNTDITAFSANGGGAPEVVGQGGSLATMTIASSTLYSLERSRVTAFDLSEPTEPTKAGTLDLPWGIETLFPRGELLFVGAQSGMHILDLEDPLNPTHLSTFGHVTSCDPVVVNGDLAYVTLWGGTTCGNARDQLEVIDISNPAQPQSRQIVPMNKSHGLAVAEGKLFLCTADDGLKSYELTDTGLLGAIIDVDQSVDAWDIIALPDENELIVFQRGSLGIAQFTYSDDGRLTPVSTLEICAQ